MKILINHSNHPSGSWSEEQREGWDVIYDIPFPSIDPTWDTPKVEAVVEENIKEIKHLLSVEITEPGTEVWLCLLGEYTYVYSFVRGLYMSPFVDGLAVPTTQRVVVEEDGGRKTSVFKFVRWRLLPLR